MSRRVRPDLAELLVLRHGRCEDNVRDCYPRRSSTLDAVGVAQARAAAKVIAAHGLAPAPIVSSELPRALQTAIIVSDLFGRRVDVDARLNEIDFGAAEGMADEEFTRAFPDHAKWIGDGGDLGFTWPRGESRGAQIVRIGNVLSELTSSAGPPLLVTHWTVSALVRSLLTTCGVEGWEQRGLEPGAIAWFTRGRSPDEPWACVLLDGAERT